MNTNADKSSANTRTNNAHQVSDKKSNSKKNPSQFIDNRTETKDQRNLQETASNSPQVQQLKAIQLMVDTNSAIAQLSAAQLVKNEMSIKGDLRAGGYVSDFADAFLENHVLPAGNTNYTAAQHHSGRTTKHNTIVVNARTLKDELIASRWRIDGNHFVAATSSAIDLRKTTGIGTTFAAAPVLAKSLTHTTHPLERFTITGVAPAQTVSAIEGVTADELTTAKGSVGAAYPKSNKRVAYRGNLLKNINSQRARTHVAAEVDWIHANFSHINGVALDPAVHDTKAKINEIDSNTAIVTVFINSTTGKIYHLENS